MSEQKQIFKKQVLIIFSAFLVLFVFLKLGVILDYYGYFNYDSLYIDIAILLLPIWILVFVPLFFMYIVRLKKGKNLKELNIIYRILTWLSIVYLILIFLFWLWEYFYFSYYFSIVYLTDIDYSFVDGLKNFLIIAPLILASGLFYWSIIVNRMLGKIENKLMRNIKKLFNAIVRKIIEMESTIIGFLAILFFIYGLKPFLYLLFFEENLMGNIEYIAMSVLLMIIGAYFIIDFYFIKNKVSFRNQLNQFVLLTIIALLWLWPDGFDIYPVNDFIDSALLISYALMVLLIPLSLVYSKRNNIKPINYIFRISIYFILASFILSYVAHVFGMFDFYMLSMGGDMANSLLDTIYYSIFSPNLLISLMLLLILISNKKIVGSLRRSEEHTSELQSH